MCVSILIIGIPYFARATELRVGSECVRLFSSCPLPCLHAILSAMNFDLNRPESGNDDHRWEQLEQMAEQIADLAKSDVAAEDFYELLLKHALTACEATSATAWTCRTDASIDRCLAAVSQERDSPRIPPPMADHLGMLQAAGRQGHAVFEGSNRAGSASLPPRIACRVASSDGRCRKVIELVLEPDILQTAAHSKIELLSAFCEIAADFENRRVLESLHEQTASRSELEQFAVNVHYSLELAATAFTIVNDSRHIVGCDRVSLAIGRGRAFRVVAVSGVDFVDRRAAAIRALENLTGLVASAGETCWYESGIEQIPPQLEAALNNHIDQSHARTVSLVPLHSPQHDTASGTAKADRAESDLASPNVGNGAVGDSAVVGVLVFEWFDVPPERAKLEQRIDFVARHSSVAIANARLYERIPLRRPFQTLQRMFSPARLPRWLVALAAAGMLVACLILIPADFYVHADGEIMPATRRRVFAPVNGDVQQLLVRHAEFVRRDQPLLQLFSSELDYEYARVLGEISTTEQQLVSTKASRMGTNPTDEQQRVEFARLAAQEEQLKESLASLIEQREILARQRGQLSITSPIDGQILTWDIADRLESRPVNRGQLLLTVVDVAGDWQLILRVPDRDAGFVRDALLANGAVANGSLQNGAELTVDFSLTTSTDEPLTGKVREIANRTQVGEDGQLWVEVVVEFDKSAAKSLRPGASAYARVHCGQRSLGYVWLHDLITAVRRWLFV